MQEKGVGCVFHYVPLHSSRFSCDQFQPAPLLPLTVSISEKLVRLPFWLNLDQSIELVIASSVFTLS
jgi:dTDP-4-amino-4,6-dideoxygalactose transaminase